MNQDLDVNGTKELKLEIRLDHLNETATLFARFKPVADQEPSVETDLDQASKTTSQILTQLLQNYSREDVVTWRSEIEGQLAYLLDHAIKKHGYTAQTVRITKFTGIDFN